MTERFNLKMTPIDYQNKTQNQQAPDKKYFTFFENAPIALMVEDFSKLKTHIEKVVKENNTDVISYINENPSVISKLASLIIIKDVNATTLTLFKAKTKQELLKNLNRTFTEKSTEAFKNLIIDILTGKKETEAETVNKTLNGEILDITIKFKVIEGSEETLENIIVSIEDITERINTRRALAESEKRYRESQEVAKIGSWEYDFSAKKIYWSDEAFELIESKPQKNISLEFYLSHVHIDDRELVKNVSANFLLKNQNQNLRYRIITKQGKIKYISEKRSVQIKDGRIVKIIGICQDITENVHIEQKLNVTKNLLSKTLTSIKDGFIILDYNSNYLYLNNEAAKLLGVKNPEEVIGKHIWTEFPEKEGDVFFDNYQKVLKTKKPISFENYFKPWNRWFENRIIPSSEGIIMFFHEITSRKIDEEKIEKAYDIINKSSSVVFLCKNERYFPIEYISKNTEKLFGYTSEEVLSNTFRTLKIIHPDNLDYVQSLLAPLKRNQDFKGFKTKAIKVFSKNGNVRWIEVRIDVIKDSNGKTTHIQGIAEDITEQKISRDLLFKSNQRLEEIFKNTPLGIIIWDLDFNVLEWNNSSQRIFGYTVEESKVKSIKDLINPPHLISEMKKFRDKFASLNFEKVTSSENITKDGKTIICRWYNVQLKDARGNITGFASLIEDVTERINSKKALEKSERKYRDIFEKSIDAVIIIKNGKFVNCNESTLRIFDYDNKQSLLQKHPSILSPEKQPDGTPSYLKAEGMMKIALEKGHHRFRWNHQQKNGRVFPAEVSLTRINTPDNIPTIHTVIRDITERVKNEQLENVLYNISRAALTINDFNKFGLFLKDELQTIIDTSNFYVAIYNEKTNMITTPIFVDEKEEVEEFSAEGSLTGHVIKTKKPLLLTNNEHRSLIRQGVVDIIGAHSECWMGVPLLIDGKAIGAIVVQSYDNKNAFNKSDVNLLEFVADQISTTIQRKKIEDELTQALAKAQESDKLKSSFLANMSHEIRTPMNGIIGFSELFLEPNLSNEDREKYANVVINSSKQLLTIVNDILDISKIEAGVVKLNYESTNVNRMLDNLYAFYKPKAEENNLELNCVKGLENFKSVISIDRIKLNQVLTNLLSNAFKFTDKGSIDFGYEFIENKLQFYVKDTGVGIEEDIQDKIFDRFIQANQDLNKKLQGTGLGLAISKRFIELFKGDIWIDSNTKGTTIYFTIPYIKEKEPLVSSIVEEQKPNKQVKNKKLTILVAEDEEYNMMYINELFSKTNYTIIEASNGKKAVELLENHPEIDLVFLDIKMPIMDGNEAMIEIKKENPSLPVIALSAFAMESDKESALKKGFDAYLTKPINKKHLFSLIDKHAN
ncbi:PAS domain S-box protein [Lutibacter profundi]|nr:PAS domain S-box protein [Lutibacter profundi]